MLATCLDEANIMLNSQASQKKVLVYDGKRKGQGPGRRASLLTFLVESVVQLTSRQVADHLVIAEVMAW